MRIKPIDLFVFCCISPSTFFWVGAAAGAYQIGSSLASGKKRKRDAAKLTRMNINSINQEEKETLRKLDYNQKQLISESVSQISSSGLRNEGSTQAYLKELEKNYKNERSWEKRYAQSRRRAASLGGDVARQEISSSTAQGVISGVSNIASWFKG